MLDFAALGLWINLLIFAVAAAAVLFAGTRMSGYAAAISHKTGIGQVLIGMLLLGGVTSLPELVVSVTSSLSGDTALAINGILGGIAMQVAILAVADALIGRKALTSSIPDPVVMLQGSLTIMLLSLVAAAIVVGDTPILGVGVWMWLVAGLAGYSFWAISRAGSPRPWRVSGGKALEEKERKASDRAGAEAKGSLRSVIIRAVAAGTVIVIAGYVLSRSGDALAEQTGLGESYVGIALLAIATSLPEVSTVFSAVRMGLYTMAVADIFGTNLIDLSFLVIIDATNGSGAAITEVGRFSTFATLMAITVTAIFIAGLAERRDRTILRMGVDSIAVLVAYLSSLVVLYFLR